MTIPSPWRKVSTVCKRFNPPCLHTIDSLALYGLILTPSQSFLQLFRHSTHCSFTIRPGNGFRLQLVWGGYFAIKVVKEQYGKIVDLYSQCKLLWNLNRVVYNIYCARPNKDGENRMTRSFLTCSLRKILFGWSNQE